MLIVKHFTKNHDLDLHLGLTRRGFLASVMFTLYVPACTACCASRGKRRLGFRSIFRNIRAALLPTAPFMLIPISEQLVYCLTATYGSNIAYHYSLTYAPNMS
jgi:hypothetical protein